MVAVVVGSEAVDSGAGEAAGLHREEVSEVHREVGVASVVHRGAVLEGREAGMVVRHQEGELSSARFFSNRSGYQLIHVGCWWLHDRAATDLAAEGTVVEVMALDQAQMLGKFPEGQALDVV